MKNRSFQTRSILAVFGLAASLFDAQRNLKANSPIFNEMSGKLGGAVAMTGPNGIVLRGNVTPHNPNAVQQSRMRAILAGLAAAWRNTLTDVQRAGWTALKSQGESGIDVFVAANCILLQAGGTRVVTAPATRAAIFTPFSAGTGIAPTIGLLSVCDNGNIYWYPANVTDTWNATAGGVLNLYCSKPQKSSRLAQQFNETWVGGKVRGVSAVAAAQTTATGLTLVAGQIVYVRITTAGVDGSVSADQVIRMVVSAAA